jgi:glycosyltransferase involved in cell wall biosynthesis
VEDIYLKIREIYDNPSLREDLSKKGLEHVKKYSTEAVMKIWEDVLDDIARRKKNNEF